MDVRAWRRLLEGLARQGLVAQGLVYGLVGLLAGLAAVSSYGVIAEPITVLALIGAIPLGHLVVAAIGVGMIGYAAWRVVQSAADLDGTGHSFRAIFVRLFGAIGGLGYAALGYGALRIAFGGGAGDAKQRLTGDVLELPWPFGTLLVAAFGLGVIGAAIYQVVQAFTLSQLTHLRREEMSRSGWRVTSWLSRFGMASRGLVLLVVGGMFVLAGIHDRAQDAAGLSDGLRFLARQPYGRVILGVTSLGLVAFCATAWILARHREIFADRKT